MTVPARPASRTLSLVFIVAAAAPILVATLYPAGPHPPEGWTFWFTGDEAFAELIQNLLLFMPFGAALAIAGRRPLGATLLGAALSLSVEFAQQWIPGRDPNVGDIVCNSLGTAGGAALVWSAPRWLFVAPARAAWQALGLATLAAGTWIVTGWLLAHRAAVHSLRLETPPPRAPHTIGDGWRLIFFPDSFPAWALQLLDAIWLAGWLVLVGYWAGPGNWKGASGVAIGIAIAALFVTPWIVPLAPTPVWEGSGALLGLALGVALRRVSSPPRSGTTSPAAS